MADCLPCALSPEAAEQGRGPLVLDCPLFLLITSSFVFLEHALYAVAAAAGSSCSELLPVLSPVPGTYPALLTCLPASIGGVPPPTKLHFTAVVHLSPSDAVSTPFHPLPQLSLLAAKLSATGSEKPVGVHGQWPSAAQCLWAS